MLVVCNDVTERHRLVETLRANEEHLKLLANELNHRVKNTLATVQAIGNPDPARWLFNERRSLRLDGAADGAVERA